MGLNGDQAATGQLQSGNPATVFAGQSIQAVLFDLDGTLIDSAPDLGAAVDRMRTLRGLPSLPMETYRPLAGAGARGMLGVAFGMTPEHPDFPAYREEFFLSYEMHLLDNTYAFDGIAVLLQQLRALALPWGIVTNKSERFTLPLVRRMPVLQPADVVVSGDTTPHAKPHPAPLLEAARRLDLPASACLYVGDDRRDMEAAHAAGMPCVAAAWGYLGEHAIQAWGAHAIAHAPGDVLALLGGENANAGLEN